MQGRLRLIEIHQEIVQESLGQRIQQTKAFSVLGPPELLHLTRVKTRVFGKKQTKTSFSFLTGLAIPTPAHLSLFLTQLMTFQKEISSTVGNIEKAQFCIFDAFNRVDVHVEIRIPGGSKMTIYNKSGDAIDASRAQQDQFYERAFFSSIIRTMSRRYFPFLKVYDQVLQPEVLEPLLPKLLPFLFQNNLQLESTHLTKSNYAIDIVFEEVMQQNLTKMVNSGLKVLQNIESNIGNLMVCCIQWEQMQYKNVLRMTAMCQEFGVDYDFLKVQARALLKLKELDKALKISKFLVLSSKSNDIPTWETLCRCLFFKGQYKQLMVTLNTGVCVIAESNRKVDQWTTNREQLPSIMYKNNKGFSVTKPTSILEASLQPNYCINFKNEYVNRFSKIKSIKLALLKQNKQLKILKLLQRTQTVLSFQSAAQLFKLLIMLERLKGWEYLMNVRNRVFWLESDFASVSSALLEDSDTLETEKSELNSQMLDVSLSENSDQGHVQRTEMKEDQVQQLDEADKDSQKQASIIMSTNSIDDNDSKPSVKQPSPITKTMQPPICNKHLNEMYKQKILCSQKFEQMFNGLYQHLSLLLELDSWEQSLKPPSAYNIDRNELNAIVLLKKSFVENKLLRFRKAESSLKKSLKYVQFQTTKVSIQYHLCQLYLQGRRFKACELFMVEMLTTLWNIGVREYDTLPLWLVQMIRSVVDAIGGITEFQQAVKKWPPRLANIIWQRGLKRIYRR